MKVKKLHPDAKLPVRGTLTSAGYDLYSVWDGTIPFYCTVCVPTGIALEIPPGYVGLICDRSGLGVRGITTRLKFTEQEELIDYLNSLGPIDEIQPLAGVIDEDYRGEIRVVLYNTTDKDFVIKKGDRIAQIVFEKLAPESLIQPMVWSDNLSETQRGSAGFGSTGV